MGTTRSKTRKHRRGAKGPTPFAMTPNRLTVETLAKCDRGEDRHPAKDADDLFGQLGV